MNTLRDFLMGPPLPTRDLETERLNKIRALAAFSPDALSSIAYANQEIYLGLVVAGAAGLVFSWPIALTIVGLLAILTLSYNQTIPTYPSGGGSYTVAHENLGSILGLIAAAALLIDYVLTAAVSLTAGVAAIASAFPLLWDHRVAVSLVILLVITLINLRGVRESGTMMALPVYLFLGCYLVMIAYGLYSAKVEGPGDLTASAPSALVPVTLVLILHTFASGCTALTGVEAISNGIPAFKPPSTRNAQKTLIIMAVLMGILFAGTIGLTQYFAVVAGANETILSALTRRILGTGPLYYLVQIATLLILSVAANTSFNGFPRLASVLAKDRYLPNQFVHLGDRLVYSNGIMILSLLTGLLIVVFRADSHALVPLFAIGAFLAFTLSQAGMVAHWFRERGRHWQAKAFINGLGAATTLVALLIIAVNKFRDGAWIVIFLIPLLVVIFQKIKFHYNEVANELTLSGLPPSLKPPPDPRIVIPISGVHRGVINAVLYARSISDRVTAVYVETDPEQTAKVRKTWGVWGLDVPLIVVPSPYRSLIGPLLDYLDETDKEHNDGERATVLLPEFVPVRWWHHLLHNQTATLLRLALLYNRRKFGYTRAIIEVPFHLRK
ncbi:MAG: ydaO [Acidobacteria bacterium]|nr:ydaO [Acidobacteriota bacterium]